MVAFNKIELGMTRNDVEAVVGGPPGTYYSGPTEVTGEEEGLGIVVSAYTPSYKDSCAWSGRDGLIMIVWDDGKVVGAFYQGKRSRPEPVAARLKRLFGL